MTAETMIALCALGTSLIALGFSIYFGWCTRDHNRRSVKPLPYVAPNDYENELSVRLWNYGSGPMILSNVICRHVKLGLSGHLIDLLPTPPDKLHFDEFVKVHSGRALPPGECLDLIQLTVKKDEVHAVDYRDKLRDFLGNVSVEAEYTDIYETSFPTYTRVLDWFHR
jgi:hypothetical protein